MRDRRRPAGVEAVDGSLERSVGFGDSLVLAQVLKPRIDHERFDPASFFSRILEHAPAVGAITLALGCYMPEGGEKRVAVFRLDPVFDRHQYRTAVLGD